LREPSEMAINNSPLIVIDGFEFLGQNSYKKETRKMEILNKVLLVNLFYQKFFKFIRFIKYTKFIAKICYEF
jgi:hypothetical protein